MFRKLGIEIIERGDDLIIPARESYEIETFMDGSILTKMCIRDSVYADPARRDMDNPNKRFINMEEYSPAPLEIIARLQEQGYRCV